MTARYGKDWDPAKYYQDSAVAETYDEQRFASLAGRVFDRTEKRILLLALAGLQPKALVADVPCGTGRLAETLLDHGFRVHGIDISPQMLSVAERRLRRFGDRFQTQVLDVRYLAEQNRRFDAALCARVLMHLPFPEQVQFLRNVASVTDGPVIFWQGLDSSYNRMRRAIKRVLGHQNPAVYPLTAAKMRELIRAAGLREVRRYYMFRLLSEAVIVVTKKV